MKIFIFSLFHATLRPTSGKQNAVTMTDYITFDTGTQFDFYHSHSILFVTKNSWFEQRLTYLKEERWSSLVSWIFRLEDINFLRSSYSVVDMRYIGVYSGLSRVATHEKMNVWCYIRFSYVSRPLSCEFGMKTLFNRLLDNFVWPKNRISKRYNHYH